MSRRIIQRMWTRTWSFKFRPVLMGRDLPSVGRAPVPRWRGPPHFRSESVRRPAGDPSVMVLPFESGKSSPYRWGVPDISVDASPAQGQASDRPYVGLNVGESIPPEQTAIVAAVSTSVSRGPTRSSRVKVAGYSPALPPAKRFRRFFARLVNLRSRLVEPLAFFFKHWFLHWFALHFNAEPHLAGALARPLIPL